MRIAIVSLRSVGFHVAGIPGGGGGAEAQSTALARALAAQGHDVRVIVTDYTDERRRLPRLTSLPLINAFNTNDGLPGLRFVTPRWTGMMRALAEADADVYFQMCAGLATWHCARFCRAHRRGFVFATASDSDVVPGAVRLSPRDRWFYARGIRAADEIITQHHRQAAMLKAHFGLDSTPLTMGVSIPDEPGRPAEPPFVLWLGSVRPVKRPELWLAMARRIPGTRFVMVGGPANDPAYFEGIRRAAAGIPNVEFVGPVPDVQPYVSTAGLLLNTSEIEGFPNTFLEAWALAVPTVSFFDPGDVVRASGISRIVADDAEMEASIHALLADRKERSRLGRVARDYVRRHYSIEAVAAATAGIMTRALEKARARP